jgi:hypothetical protein
MRKINLKRGRAVILRIIWRGLLNGILRIGCHPADRLGGCPGSVRQTTDERPPSNMSGILGRRREVGQDDRRTAMRTDPSPLAGHSGGKWPNQASFGGQPRVCAN